MTTNNPFILEPGELPTPASATENPFEAVGRDLTQQRLAAGVVRAAGTEPDTFGRWRQQQDTLGVPADVAARNPADASRRALEVRLGQVQAEQPRLAAWLSETPERVALAQDQIEHLSFADRIVTGLQWYAGVPLVRAAMDFGETGTPTDDLARRFGGGGVQFLASARVTYFDKVIAGSGGEETLRQNLAALPAQQAQLRAMGHTTLADLAGRVGRYFQGFLDLKAEAVQVQAAVDEMRAETDAGLGRGDLQYYANRAADSGFVMALSLATGGAARLAGASGGTAAWAAGAASGGSTYLDAYQRARAEGYDTDIADATATSQAVIEVLFERFGLAKAFGEAETVGRRALQTIGREAVGEGATTAGQTTADALITDKTIDGADLGWEVLDSMIVGGLMGGPEAVLGTLRATPADRRRAREKLDQVLRSAGTSAQLAALVEVARDAKLADRAPDEARAFVDHLVGQSGAATHVFVDAAQFTTLYQSASLDPAAAAADLTGDPDAYGRAIATGGDIAIPMNRYLTDVVRSAVADQIGQHARTAADNLSPAELAVFKAEDFLGEVLGLDAAGRAEASARGQADEQAIVDDVTGQLLAAKIEPGTAARYAKLYGAVFRTLARRTGKPATELWERYGLRIRRQTKGDRLLSRDPRVEMTIDPLIDAALAGKAPSDREIFGDSLVATIIRMGGIDPNSTGGGDLRAQDANRRPGLLSLGGRTLEAMAEALAQQDMFPDVFSTKDEFGRPDYRELVDLIRQELSGERVYAEGNADLLSLRENIERVGAALRVLAVRDGVDPMTIPRAELRERVLDVMGEELFQRTFHGTFYRGIEQAGFKLSKVNTGEGAQLYGWGIYFTSSKGIAEWYRSTVTEKRSPSAAATFSFVGFNGARQTLVLNDDGQMELAALLAQDYGPAVPDFENDDTADEDGFFVGVQNAASVLMVHIRDHQSIPGGTMGMAGVTQLTLAEQKFADLMIENLHKVKARVSPPADFTFDGVDGRVGATWLELRDNLWDEFEGGVEDDQVIHDAANVIIQALKDGQNPRDVRLRSDPLLFDEMVKFVESLNVTVTPKPTGQVYETDIPDDGDLLSWADDLTDLPSGVLAKITARAESWLRENDALVQSVVGNTSVRVGSPEHRARKMVAMLRDLTATVYRGVDGREFYQTLAAGLGSQQAASHWLYEAGIPGLRFPAGQISGQKTDATNYVIWDESRMDVVRTLYQSARSALVDSVVAAKGAPKKADAAAWKGWLDGAQRRGEFKAEERAWMGLDAWLEQAGTVTREQLQEFVRASQLEVTEVVLGEEAKADLDNLPFKPGRVSEFTGQVPVFGPTGAVMSYHPDMDDAEIAAYHYSSGFLRSQGVALGEIARGFTVARLDPEMAEAHGLQDAVGQWALFSATYPEGEPVVDDLITNFPNVSSYARAIEAAIAEGVDGAVGVEIGAAGSPSPAPYASMVIPGGKNYRVMLLTLPDVRAADQQRVASLQAQYRRMVTADGLTPEAHAVWQESKALEDRMRESVFRGGHWQEPNVVAHVRFDERTDADGKRVLFVQELQSDWHQQGRRKGYAKVNQWFDVRNKRSGFTGRPFDTREAAQAFIDNELPESQRGNVEIVEREERLDGVPDAPFKTTWHEMAMRRVVAYAVERGFDRVAWPTEAMVPQIEQWGMSVEQIKADPAASKRFGAILARYSEAIPRFMKAFGKPFGAKVGTSAVTIGASSDSIPAPPAFDFVSDIDWQANAGASAFSAGDRPLQAEAWVMVDGARQQVTFLLSDEGVSVYFPRGEDGEIVYSQQSWDELGYVEPSTAREAIDKFNLIWTIGVDVEGQQDISLWDDGWDFDLKPVVKEDVSIPSLEITPAMRDAAEVGLPLFQEPDDPRGSIEIGGDRQMRINLFERADLSTFLHESGHFFLEVLGDLAEADDATDQVKADYAALLSWMGVASRAEIGVPQHEQLARGFEAYLREGRAPNEELASLFTRFRAWLTTIYRQLTQLDVTLTDEVRGVFDRLIATDEEIAAIEADQSFGPVGDRTALGLSEAAMEAYEAMLKAATEEARTDVTRRLLRAQQREAQAWWREELDALRAEVAAELDATPVYRALSVLRTGKWPDGSEGPLGGARLSRDALTRLWGAAFVQQRLRGLYAAEGGVVPDAAAAVLGFADGAALVQALAEARPRRQAIDAIAKERMAERHPDPLTDGQLAERAMTAAHGNKRLAALQFELDTLAALAGTTAPKARVLRAAATFEIGRQVVRSVKPAAYLVAERKAAREAARLAAKGRYAEAFRAKRAQALNAALYRQAQEAVAQAEKAQRLGQSLSQQKVRAKFGKAGQAFLEQLDVILGQYAFGNMGPKEADRRQRVAVELQRQVDAGTLVLPAHVMRQVLSDQRMRWDQLTVEQLTGLYDTLRQLQHQAREADRIRIGDITRAREEVDADMAGSVLGANRTLPEHTGDRTRTEKLVKAWGQGRALQGTASDIARELDGFAAGGPVWTHVVQVIRDAVTRRLNPALRDANEAVAELYRQHFTKAQLRALDRPKAYPGIRGEWSHGRVLALALNWGNDGNREAVLTQARGRLSPEQVGQLLGTLTAKDWDFVEAVWAHIDTYREAAFAVEQRKTGMAPERVEGSSFSVTLPDGSARLLRGGYYPLKYDADSVKSMHDEASEYEDLIRSGRSGMSKVPAGSMIARVGSGGRSVRLDLGVLEQHLRDTLRIIHLSEPVNAASVALAGPDFRAAVADVGMLEHVRALELWLKDVAAGEIAPRVFHEKAARAVRQNFTASVLGFKLASALLQVTGIAQTGVVLGWEATLGGVQQYVRRPKAMARYVDEASPMMAARAQTHTEAVAEVLSAQQGRLKASHAALVRWAYWMMGRVQRTVDIATWLAAEAEGLRQFDGDVDRARAFADDTVIRAQGSQEFTDKTPLQRGTLGEGVRQSEYIKATTMLAGYMLAKGNAAYEQTRKTNFRSAAQALRWSANMTSLFVVEGMIAAAIKGAWPEDEDEDGPTEEVAWAALREGFFSLFGSVPGLNTLSGQLRGYDGGGVLGGTAKMLNDFTEQVRQGEMDRALRKVTVNLIGVGTGAPSAQINKTLDAIDAARDGEDVSALEYVNGPQRR